MFVRIKSSPNSPRKVVQLVESSRNAQGQVRQRIVRHIGIANDAKELRQLQEVAEVAKASLANQAQPYLFHPEEIAELAVAARQRPPDPDEPLRVDLKQLEEDQRILVGVHEVCGALYEELGLGSVLRNPARKKASVRNLRHIVLARLANPQSKRFSVDDLARRFGVELSLPGVYRMMDQLDEEAVARLKDRARNAAEKLFKERIRVVFYDCTTLYFESFTPDDLKQNGYSKDLKFSQPQVLLALLVTPEGLPLGYEVFPGATFEGHTLKLALEQIRTQWAVEEIVVVADSAMLGQANLALLESSGYRYVVAARLKNLPDELKAHVLERAQYQNCAGESHDALRELDYGQGRRLVISYSKQRARKDAHERQDALRRLTKRLAKSRNPTAHLKGGGTAKFLRLEGPGTLAVDEARVAEAARWDGLRGVVSNLSDQSPADLLSQYHGLWKIEECFRVSKTDLRIRPIFHWTPKRVRAHLAICFMALLLIRHLEYRLRLQIGPLSPDAIIRHLLTVQVSILRHCSQPHRYALPSNPSREAEQIYRASGLRLSRTPYRLPPV